MFSGRLPSLGENRLAIALAGMRARGAPFIDLTETNPTRVGLEYPADLLAPLADAGALGYEPEPCGLRSARQAVAADLTRIGATVSSDDLVLTSSTSEAYGFLFKLLCDPGDEVLVPMPSYPLFEHLTMLDGVRAVPYALDAAGGWSIDLAAIEHATGPRTRAVLAVSPNNPTGSILRAREIGSISALCRARGLALIGDEVFADYRFATAETGPCFPSVLSQRDCLTFALGGLSKSIGLPQVKLGWIAIGGPAALVSGARARLEIIADTYLSVGTPVQLALPALFERGAEVRRRIQQRVQQNLACLREVLRHERSCTASEPAGGWSAAVRVPATSSEEDLVSNLLERHGVRVAPGYFFDFPSEAWLVVSLLGPPDAFEQGMRRVVRAL